MKFDKSILLIFLVSFISLFTYSKTGINEPNIAIDSEDKSDLNQIIFSITEDPIRIYTTNITEVYSNSAITGGFIVNEQDYPIDSLGVCWNTQENPVVDNNRTTDTINNGFFTSKIANLERNSRYFVRSYAAINGVIVYGEVKVFRTTAELATITLDSIFDVSEHTLSAHVTISGNGGTTIDQSGICWGENLFPIEEKNQLIYTGSSTSFILIVENLIANKAYHFRAFIKNEMGTNYSLNFSILTPIGKTVPLLASREVSNISAIKAVTGGQILQNGGDSVLFKGVCWSVDTIPTYEDSRTHNGNGDLEYISELSSLEPSTKYYYRAYAYNSLGIGYGEVASFYTLSAPQAPILRTRKPIGISKTSAKLAGEIINDGNGKITAFGFCWNQTGLPTIDDSIAELPIEEKFVGVVENLLPDSRYFIRSYAINEVGVAYGNEIEFNTKEELLINVGSNQLNELFLNVVDTSIKKGEIVELIDLIDFDGGTYPIDYNWQPADSINQQGHSNPTTKPDATLSYSLLITDANGCSTKKELVITVENNVSDGNLSYKLEFKAYPNPSQGIFNIEISGDKTDQLLIEVININGEVLQTININNFTGHSIQTVNILREKGVYFLRLISNVYQTNTKVLIK